MRMLCYLSSTRCALPVTPRGPVLSVDFVSGTNCEDVTLLVDESFGGTTLDHGGVGFHWTHDCMGWISDFSILHRGTPSGGSF